MKLRRPLKYKGYIYLLRRSVLLLKERKIDFADYGFYFFLLQETDWVKDRSTYGCVVKSDVELAVDSGRDPSTIGRRKRSLLRHGLIEIVNGLVRVKDFEKFTLRVARRLSKLDSANLQEDFAQTQSLIAETQTEIAKPQTNDIKSGNFFNVSSKKDLSSTNDEVGLSQEDIDWINDNVKEEKRACKTF